MFPLKKSGEPESDLSQQVSDPLQQVAVPSPNKIS